MSEVDDIVEQFGLPENPKFGSIAKVRVLDWMRSNDTEALGALYTFLMKRANADRVEPKLSFAEHKAFVLPYFQRCLLDDPQGEWAHSRYRAAWDLASWFGAIWKDPRVDKAELLSVKRWLADVYINSNEVVRRCIVNGTLEHVFENKQIADYFSDWKTDPILLQAYRAAMNWTEKGGDSGLVKK